MDHEPLLALALMRHSHQRVTQPDVLSSVRGTS